MRILLVVVASTLAMGIVQAQERISLAALPELARARSQRQRPIQQQALQPFLKDLTLGYEANKEFLDGRVQDIAQLGDSIVPLLLENLSPTTDSEEARNLAANSARVLEHLDPGGFVDSLDDLVRGRNDTAVRWSIHLLGRAASPRAAKILTERLDELRGGNLRAAVQALTTLHATDPAPQIVKLAKTDDGQLHKAVLEYLAAVRPPRVLDAVLAMVAADRAGHDLPWLLPYLVGAAPEQAGAAEALLPFLEEKRTDREQQMGLVGALATIAPKGHKPTLQALRQILDPHETGRLGRAAAVAMQQLGDKTGRERLFHNLDEQLKRKPRDGQALAQRGDANMSFQRWNEAIKDYNDALRHSKDAGYEQSLYLLLARCEAHAERWPRVLKALQDGKLTRDTILKEAEKDPEFQKALQRDSLQRFLKSLPR